MGNNIDKGFHYRGDSNSNKYQINTHRTWITPDPDRSLPTAACDIKNDIYFELGRRLMVEYHPYIIFLNVKGFFLVKW